MKLIIAGGRDLDIGYHGIAGAITLHKLTRVSTIISGGAKGVDSSARLFAQGDEWENYPVSLCEKYKEFPADWGKHGRAAGPIRNKQMADYADALLLIWDGKSKGSSNMKETMLKQNKPVYEVILRKSNG
tara:strand:- start:451 stop:840 length:390 start_codon:yes stop_codon:yes gene_type:complete